MSEDDYRKAIERITEICNKSGQVSQIFSPGTPEYLDSIKHYFESSDELPRVVVQPGREYDLSSIMRVLSEFEVDFAVQGGGHTSNPTFSSTKGIHINMCRFKHISYDAREQTITVGSGCLFEEIYAEIAKYGRNIVGGGTGVGVSGWLLGGGYSLKTNQYGLGIDNIVQIQVVTPRQTTRASKTSELFRALKGGGNNFGIVTEFTLKTYVQDPPYRDVLPYSKQTNIEAIKDAIMAFINRSEEYPKAAIVAAFRHYPNPDDFKTTVLTFYDGPAPSGAASPFIELERLCAVPWSQLIDIRPASFAQQEHLTSYLYHPSFQGHPPIPESLRGVAHDQEKRQENLALFTQKPPPPEVSGRARWGNVMVSTYTRPLIDELQKQGDLAAVALNDHTLGGKMVMIEFWPFISSMFDTSTPAAWPHKKGEPNGFILVYFLWEGANNDPFWVDLMEKVLRDIRSVAIKEKCATGVAPVYSNTALAKVTPIEAIYGKENIQELSDLRYKYDPNNVMGRAGGFRIPL